MQKKRRTALFNFTLKPIFSRLISGTQYTTTTTTHNYVYTTYSLHLPSTYLTQYVLIYKQSGSVGTEKCIEYIFFYIKNVSNILGYLEFPCSDEIATAFFCVDTFSVSLAFLGIIMAIFFSILHTIKQQNYTT